MLNIILFNIHVGAGVYQDQIQINSFKQCGVPIYNPMSIYMYIDLPDNNCCLVSLAVPLPYHFQASIH